VGRGKQQQRVALRSMLLHHIFGCGLEVHLRLHKKNTRIRPVTCCIAAPKPPAPKQPESIRSGIKTASSTNFCIESSLIARLPPASVFAARIEMQTQPLGLAPSGLAKQRLPGRPLLAAGNRLSKQQRGRPASVFGGRSHLPGRPGLAVLRVNAPMARHNTISSP